MSTLSADDFNGKNGGLLFGLRTGQMSPRTTKLMHNARWYNRAGRYIGWGDLSVEDFERIREEIDAGELFITLHEQDATLSYTRHCQRLGIVPCDEAPGLDYIISHAHYVIARGVGYIVDRHGDYTRDPENVGGVFRWKGIDFRILTQAEFRNLLIPTT